MMTVFIINYQTSNVEKFLSYSEFLMNILNKYISKLLNQTTYKSLLLHRTNIFLYIYNWYLH